MLHQILFYLCIWFCTSCSPLWLEKESFGVSPGNVCVGGKLSVPGVWKAQQGQGLVETVTLFTSVDLLVIILPVTFYVLCPACLSLLSISLSLGLAHSQELS
jgi:hypothetical protein